MIGSEELFGEIERGHPDLEAMIFACIDQKRRFVEADERDTGSRQFLNFGHSFGHAIEKESGYAVSHGSAVAAGMVVACRLSETLGLCGCRHDKPPACRAAFLRPARRHALSAGFARRYAAAGQKRSGDSITLVLCKGVGRCILRRMPFDELRALTAKTFA